MVPLVRCHESVRCPDCDRMTVPGQVLASVDDILRHHACPDLPKLVGPHISAGGAPSGAVADGTPETPSSPVTGPGAFLVSTESEAA